MSLKAIYSRFELLFATILLLLPCQIAAAQSAGSRRPIGEHEFLNLIKANKLVYHRVVTAKAIMNALRWAQTAANRKEQLPKDGLQMQDCIVEGLFTFFEIVYEGEEEKHKSLLIDTPVEQLSPELSQHYVNAGIRKVNIIPLAVRITETEFHYKYGDEQFFSDTIFESDVRFQQVTFGYTVSFENSTFKKKADFSLTTFPSDAIFADANLNGETTFDSAEFNNLASFDRAVFRAKASLGATFKGAASFSQVTIKDLLSIDGAVFQEPVYFTEATLTGRLVFSNCKFESDTFFSDINSNNSIPSVGALEFNNSVFLGRAYLTNSNLHNLSLLPIEDQDDTTTQPTQRSLSRDPNSPVSFNKRAVFIGLQCDLADFREAEFREYADFSQARFTYYVDFSNATFEGGVRFYQTDFPDNSSEITTQNGPKSGLALNGVQMPKGFLLDWNQIDGKIHDKDPETFRLLEDTFKQSGNLEGQNGAMYQRKYLEGSRAGRWLRLVTRLDLAFWGYGVRPLRLFGWMCALFALFTLVYWTQTRALASGRFKLENAWIRLKFAIAFSLRTTWKFGFGYQNSRTSAFKIITLVHSIGFKVLFILLLQAFANTSPLLNELVGKLVHI